MRQETKRFTVFTATYNRAKTLPRVYASLLAQSYKDFEWLIVDDGSDDGTADLVEVWKLEANIDIRYIYKENGGKHSAWPVALESAYGKYIICLDSDDEALQDCLAIFNKHWLAIENSENASEFWEVKALCLRPDGSINGKGEFPKPVFDSTYQELVFKYGITGDQIGCRRVKILAEVANVPKSFIYDDKAGNFPEGVRWARAGKRYKTRYVNDVVFQVHYDGSASLCRAARSSKSDYSSLVGSLYLVDENWGSFLRWQKVELVKTCLHTLSNLKDNKVSLLDHCRYIDTRGYIILLFILSPLGPFISWIRRRRFE